MRPRLLLHIGTHKTGSTSLQQFLRDENDRLLAPLGIQFARGFVFPNNHVELHILTMRPERATFARSMHPQWRDEEWTEAAMRHIQTQTPRGPEPSLVWSAEGLSYLRFDDEFDRLANVFGDADIEIVVFVRDRAEFLESYKATLHRDSIPLSRDPDSIAYVEPDSWLVDVGARIAMWRRRFGAERVTIFDYDALVQSDASIIPAFASMLGIDRAALPDLRPYYLNARTSDEALQ